MGWSGQEDGMDVMKEIIQKEIQSISSLEERVIFKNLMEGVFLSLYDTNREMYEGLERRIKEELDYDKPLLCKDRHCGEGIFRCLPPSAVTNG